MRTSSLIVAATQKTVKTTLATKLDGDISNNFLSDVDWKEFHRVHGNSYAEQHSLYEIPDKQKIESIIKKASIV